LLFYPLFHSEKSQDIAGISGQSSVIEENIYSQNSNTGVHKLIELKTNIQLILKLLKQSFSDIHLIILYSPLFFFYTIIAAGFTVWLRQSKKLRTPYTRKVFHFLIFTMAAILQLLTSFSVLIIYGTIVSLFVLYSVFRGNGFTFYECLARETDVPHRTLYIIIPLISTAAGGMVSNLLFYPFAPVGYLTAGWGDAVGEPVGTKWGKHKYKVTSITGVKATRSLEGSTAVFIVSVLVAFIVFFVTGVKLPSAIIFAIVCGTAGTVVEAFSSHGLDNFTMQVCVSGAAFFLMV
jgi:phytol kinase